MSDKKTVHSVVIARPIPTEIARNRQTPFLGHAKMSCIVSATQNSCLDYTQLMNFYDVNA